MSRRSEPIISGATGIGSEQGGLLELLRLPTREQYLAYFAAWSGWVLDAFDFTIFLLVMPQIAKEFGATHVATTGSIALTLLMRLLGGWVAGAAADRWGRKLPLLLSVVWFALCDGAVALAPSFTAVLVLRTLFGIGMGAEWTSGTTLAMESMPKRLRGLASGVLQGSWAIGYLLAAAVSAIVLPRWGWRAMFVVAALPALFTIPMRWWVKESPEIGARVAHEKYAFPLRRAFREEPALLRKVAWGSATMATGFGAYYGLTSLYPTMLRLELGASDGGVALLVALFNVGMMTGSIVIGLLATKRGPAFAIGVPAALAVLAIPLYAGVVPGGLEAGAFLGGAIGCGFCGATPIVLTSLFPAPVRARLVGLVYHIGAAGAALVPMAIAALAKSTGMRISSSMMIVAIACEVAVVLLVAWPAVAERLTVRRMTSASAVLGAVGLIGALAAGSAACLTSNVNPFATDAGAEGGAGGGEVEGDDPSTNEGIKDSPTVTYRALDSHPGCTVDGLTTRAASAYNPATIPGYRCAAKAYPLPNGDDPNKPIVLLVHGNSSTPADYETFEGDPTKLKMLSERLVDAGYRVLAVDVRFDKVDDPDQNNADQNAGKNFDHGWGVPIIQHFIESVLNAYPDRKISIVAFSVGPTMVRDSLRRLHAANKKPYARIKDLVFGSGAHHGVSTFRALCGSNPTMRGRIACELGDRTSYQPTDFAKPNNGPNGAWETPCLDGDTAYGQKGVCDGNEVRYTTVVMKDVAQGSYQDEFVSEGASALAGAKNLTVALTDNDLSNYFYNGIFKNHYGAIRSEAGLQILMDALTAP